ncbi:MAG: hypothetical protein RIT14_1135 [Pseudomonadota bacterium]|jgi:hypothetical protein
MPMRRQGAKDSVTTQMIDPINDRFILNVAALVAMTLLLRFVVLLKRDPRTNLVVSACLAFPLAGLNLLLVPGADAAMSSDPVQEVLVHIAEVLVATAILSLL